MRRENIKRKTTNEPYPIGSMGRMVYIPTFTRDFSHSWIGKYTSSSHGSVMGIESRQTSSHQLPRLSALDRRSAGEMWWVGFLWLGTHFFVGTRWKLGSKAYQLYVGCNPYIIPFISSVITHLLTI